MRRIYAIGDIHGMRGKLHDLMARCERDAGDRPRAFVFVGDYIDRGPDSRGVIDDLIALKARMPAPGQVTTLMGNHEAIALEAIEDSSSVAHWLTQGGIETLRSYGVSRPNDLPADHVAWLRALRRSYDDGRRMFVHAGVNPSRPLDAQDEDDLIWIRRPFLQHEGDFGRLVVHGHTPTAGEPELRSNRVNVDTGAVYGHALTAAVFDEDETRPVGFIQSDA
jgi:serine/threonine protein phosphatase 1